MKLDSEMPALPDWSIAEALDWIGKIIPSKRTANFSLLLELQAGSILATTIDPDTGARTALPPEHWLHISRLETKGRMTFRLPTGQRAEAPNGGIVVGSVDVQRIWQVTDENINALPELMSPTGDGNMPLYFVALWIARKGGAVAFGASQSPDWGPAYRSIVDAASSGAVQVVGKRRGKFRAIPARRFVEMAVEYPNAEFNTELWDGDEMFLHSVEYVDDYLWRKGGFCDDLVRYKKTKWSHLMIAKADVRRLWPFAGDGSFGSGRPGRPSSESLILREFERRSEANELEPSLRAQARILATWCKAYYPEQPSAKSKTIERMLRPYFQKRNEGSKL